MAIWKKLFSKITFKNYPDTSTPIDAVNLNKITNAINGIDDRVIELNSILTNVSKVYLSEKGNTLDSSGKPIWTYRAYSDGMIEAWRYATISAKVGKKTNTLGLPFTMKDTEYIVELTPVFNGHLVNSIWSGTPTGADGRTTTTMQISMNSQDSDSNVGVVVRITGYKS